MGSATILGLSSLDWLIDSEETGEEMPVLFVGHGSPMNALESNIYTQNWKKIAEALPGRTDSQCSQRWRRYRPDKKRKQRDEEEDKKLLQYIK